MPTKTPRSTQKKTAPKRKAPARKPSTRRKRPKKVAVPVWATIATAALLVAVLIGLPWLRQPRVGDGSGEKLPPMSFSACGIDISHNNRGPIIWDSLMVVTDRSGSMVRSLEKAKNVYPVKFVFIKATEGQSMKDPAFRENWRQAGDRDIQRGAYHFFRSSKDPHAQARNFISAVGELRHSDLPPVLDIETIHRGCSKKLLNDRALVWLHEIEKHYDRTPIIYASEYFVRDVLSSEITEHYPIWVAHYGVDAPTMEGWDYWQFTESATVYGVPGPVDLSIRR